MAAQVPVTIIFNACVKHNERGWKVYNGMNQKLPNNRPFGEKEN